MSFKYKICFVSAYAMLALSVSAERVLTLPEAVVRALENNPSLKAYSYAPRIAEAQKIQAGIRPNPVASLEFEDFLGTGEYSGGKSLQTTLSLSQVIDLSGSVDKRVFSAGVARDIALADYEIKRLDVLSDIAWRFMRVAAQQRRFEIAKLSKEIGKKTAAAVRARVDIGAESEIELNRAEISLAYLELQQAQAASELDISKNFLSAQMGDLTPNFDRVAGDIESVENIPDFKTLAARMQRSPALERFGLEVKWYEAQLHLEQSLKRSAPIVSAGIRRNEASDSFGLVAMISAPLPFRDETAGSVIEARERRNRAEASADAERLQMMASLYEVYAQAVSAKESFERLNAVLIPTARNTLALVQAGYSQGRYSLLDLFDAQKSLAELSRQAVDKAEIFKNQVVTIERLLGAPINGDFPLKQKQKTSR